MKGFSFTAAMRSPLFRLSVITLVPLLLSACGGGGSQSPTGASPLAGTHINNAEASGVIIAGNQAGVTPFINFVKLNGIGLKKLASVGYIIEPKAGSVSKPVNVTYSMSALSSRGYMVDGTTLTLPVFGLYAGYTNQVSLQLTFQDGSSVTLGTQIATTPYNDPTGIFSAPTILTARTAGSSLGYDFFYLKSVLGSPVVLDTDGAIRWVVPLAQSSFSTILLNGEFLIGNAETPNITHLAFDGTVTTGAIDSSTYTMFHHNIEQGKTGYLSQFNVASGGVQNVEATIAEMTSTGSFLNSWDLAAIISAYMTSHGDDASLFVRYGVDWFHSNSAIYDPSDNTLIVSSRENFVMKLDYLTGDIKWILGDPTKYWYTFPSLRAKALTLAAGGLYPIGQHALSITSDGLLMLFNDGAQSFNEPAGAPAGVNRDYSAVSAYSIDSASMTAQNVWNFRHEQSIYSEVCGSAYQALDHSLLIDYATADELTQDRLVGLDSSHKVAFDFQFATVQCDTSWNAVPISLDNFQVN